MDTRVQVPLGVTIAALGDTAAALAWVASRGIAGVQLSATHPSMRPRDLGVSARRDLRATLARYELVVTGIDAWIPSEHFIDPSHADRAIEAACAACEFASEFGRVPVTLQLPRAASIAGALGTAPHAAGASSNAAQESHAARRHDAIGAIASAAERSGVTIADASGAAGAPWPPMGVSLDPAAVLAEGGDPVNMVSQLGPRLVSARVVDLLRSGMRGPVGAAGESRLDVLGFRVALEMAGLARFPVIDARQWIVPHAGVIATVQAWGGAIPV
jgi:sugar phosphate isomerase/epimerase